MGDIGDMGAHYRFVALILFRSILPSLAAELSCSRSHDFRHGGLHSPMAGECSPLRGPMGPAGKNKICQLGSFMN